MPKPTAPAPVLLPSPGLQGLTRRLDVLDSAVKRKSWAHVREALLRVRVQVSRLMEQERTGIAITSPDDV